MFPVWSQLSLGVSVVCKSSRAMLKIVSLGGTGLGLIMAKALEANGAKVYITGRRQEKLDEAVKQAVREMDLTCKPHFLTFT